MVGVGMITHNRPGVRDQSLASWEHFLPHWATFVLVDDASDVPEPRATHRFEANVGIAAAKNKCIELLYDAGCEHLFLVDDDVYPIRNKWWEPYGFDPMPMLSWQFRPKSRLLWRNEHYLAVRLPRGALLYCERRVIDRVGGMRAEEFPRWGDEHAEWQRRVYNAFYPEMPEPFLDRRDTGRYFFSFDEARTVPSTVPQAEREESFTLRKSLKRKYRNSTDFVPYREKVASTP